jgi:hypothetical protein
MKRSWHRCAVRPHGSLEAPLRQCATIGDVPLCYAGSNSVEEIDMKTALFLLIVLLTLSASPAYSETKVSIEETIAACKAAGVKPIGKPVQSELKKETSLIGMAYLNYIYQNDLGNEHFCQAMLLMHAQVPAKTANPYVKLFDKGMGEKTLAILEDIQLSFDYSIGRSNPPAERLKASIDKIKAALEK